MGKPREEVPVSTSRAAFFGRAVVTLGCVIFGVFYLMVAMGGASFVHECNSFLCGQLHQAVFAAIGAVALFVGAYRAFAADWSAAVVAFFGTIPILVVHVILVISDPNESIFFPLSTTPVPAISGAVLLYRTARHRSLSRHGSI